MPRKQSKPKAKPPQRKAISGPEVDADDMAYLNALIHDESKPDSLRLNALKLKVSRETAMLKERIAEKTQGMNITVQSLAEEEADEE